MEKKYPEITVMNARSKNELKADLIELIWELVHKTIDPWEFDDHELIVNILCTLDQLERPGADVEAEVALYWDLEYDEDPELAPYWEELVEVAKCLTE